MTAPLDGITVVDFSQFLAGPYASLKLLDMGARVIKVENPDGGDLSRRLYLSDTRVGADSTLFHAINRGKESIALDLKTAKGLEAARRLIAHADVVIQNFRPGVIDRLGLGYEAAQELNPGIVYGSISGFGTTGEWADQPGQDLLAQARAGIMWLSGNADQGPVPVGLPIADISAGANLVQGVLGALFRQARTGQGAHVETSLLEALIDLQFEFLTTYLNNGEVEPARGHKGSAHGYLPAPYGVFETAEGYLALAMSPLETLSTIPGLEALVKFSEDTNAGFVQRHDIHAALRDALKSKSAENWESELGRHGVWCARVLDWTEAFASSAVSGLGMLSEPSYSGTGYVLKLVGSPLRIDGNKARPNSAGPGLDEHGPTIAREFDLF